MFRRFVVSLLLIIFSVPAVGACPSASFFRGKKYSGSGQLFLGTDGQSTGEPIVVQETFDQAPTANGSLTSSGVAVGRLYPGGGITTTVWIPIDKARCKFTFASSDGSFGTAFVSRSGAQIDFYGLVEKEAVSFQYIATMHIQ